MFDAIRDSLARSRRDRQADSREAQAAIDAERERGFDFQRLNSTTMKRRDGLVKPGKMTPTFAVLRAYYSAGFSYDAVVTAMGEPGSAREEAFFAISISPEVRGDDHWKGGTASAIKTRINDVYEYTNAFEDIAETMNYMLVSLLFVPWETQIGFTTFNEIRQAADFYSLESLYALVKNGFAINQILDFGWRDIDAALILSMVDGISRHDIDSDLASSLMEGL
jgi:hypothetical protein